MNVLIDTNVALHKLLEHPAFFQPSDTIFTTDFSSGIIPAITPEYFIKVITEKQ